MKKLLLFLFICLTAFNLYSAEPVLTAEWEPALGTLVRYPFGVPEELILELAQDDILYVLVKNQNQEDNVVNLFTNWSVNLENTRFIYADTYSHWTRDWGPFSMFNSEGGFAFADQYFDGYPWVSGCDEIIKEIEKENIKGYETDDLVNFEIGEYFNVFVEEFPGYLTGGNFMTDGWGRAFSTIQMLSENAPVLTENQFREEAENYLGIDDYVFLINPEIYGIQHIDCYAKLLDEETVLIKQVPEWHPEYDCCETLVQQLRELNSSWGYEYEIHRIYCGIYENDYPAAYTNSLILNKKILVPLFGIDSDEEALRVYRNAAPGYEVIGIYYEDWYYYDALHCRTKGIFNPNMLQIKHKRLPNVKDICEEGYRVSAYIKDRSHQGLKEDSLFLVWKGNNNIWNREVLENVSGTDSFYAYIPYDENYTEYSYYISASDNFGNSETKPVTAPDDYYSFILNSTDIDESEVEVFDVILSENPFRRKLEIDFVRKDNDNIYADIYNIAGERLNRFVSDNGEKIIWNGCDSKGLAVPSGIYFIQFKKNKAVKTYKVLKIN